MTFAPLIVILLVLVLGAAATLTILFRANQAGLFRNLKSGAYVIFDEDEPVGEPQDQVFYPEEHGTSVASPPSESPSGPFDESPDESPDAWSSGHS